MKRWMTLMLALIMLTVSLPAAALETDSIYPDESMYWGVNQYMAETSLFASSNAKLNNIQLAVDALSGSVVYCGETFSFNEAIGPRSWELGYRYARNGRGAEVMAGGVSQLATTLYLALREIPEVEIAPFKSYDEKFADWYVEDGCDAVVTDYAAGQDFVFTSNYEGAIYIDAWMDDEKLYCVLTLAQEEDSFMLIAGSSTPIFGSENKIHNIGMAADALNGIILGFGDSFSFNLDVGPRTEENGFMAAENGRGVKVYGGGVAQVASTIYLAVKELECVAIDPIKTYGDRFVDGYVADPADAIITDYNAGTDFSFTYWGESAMLLFVYQEGDRLVCEIYEF